MVPEPIDEDAFCNGDVAKISPNSARLRLKPVVPTLAMLLEVAEYQTEIHSNLSMRYKMTFD